MKAAKTIALAVVLVVSPMYAADKYPPLPASVIAAKTVYIDNQTGFSQITDKAYEALSKWGRFKIVKDAKDADFLPSVHSRHRWQTNPARQQYRSIAYPHSSLRTRPNDNELWNVSKNQPFHSQTTLDIDEFKKRVEAQEKGK